MGEQTLNFPAIHLSLLLFMLWVRTDSQGMASLVVRKGWFTRTTQA